MVAIELVAGPPTVVECAVDAHYRTGSSSSRDSQEGAGVRDMTAEPTANDIEGIAAAPAPASSSAGGKKAVMNVFAAEFANGELHGRVVGVIRRNWRQYAGSLEPLTSSSQAGQTEGQHSQGQAMDVSDGTDELGGNHMSTTMVFVPVNKRIPRILISTRRMEELSHSRLLVSIDHWPADSLYPQGHYVRVLGPAGSKEVETQVLLHEFDVPHEAFTPEVMACLPPADWQITEDVVAQRTDLRHIPVVSIDPPGCKDIDDALHCIRLPNGRLEAGVHIAGAPIVSPRFLKLNRNFTEISISFAALQM